MSHSWTLLQLSPEEQAFSPEGSEKLLSPAFSPGTYAVTPEMPLSPHAHCHTALVPKAHAQASGRDVL